MDRLTLATLSAELSADALAAADAVALARERFGAGTVPEAEAAAFHLSRANNAVEVAALRVAEAFGDPVDGNASWRAGLLRRMALGVPGIRPPLFAEPGLRDLLDLRAFCHTFRHARDLTIEPERIAPLLDTTNRVVHRFRGDVRRFITEVARLEGLAAPVA